MVLFVFEESEIDSNTKWKETTVEIIYENCTQVREAGASPLHADEPGYSTKLDRDDDGVACE
ncbi:excalibur calcium-binding domain-containing protein [Chengkuizengella axinellae]|uniref:Excalibur calcium-binding domain-containing protein n=1 Tax=Chengkuizengella axinellae TaxID=3064388 RepID=A0ABT9J0E1_9BACL|nr:excalibur calcium-binding domain-containing protein [Chengkuizengella sp. 2205SS18-9]MDP5275089.1 excalibur calcium-binding domain-containing protein [Chengkuizengella sp. 2205SS18-9]